MTRRRLPMLPFVLALLLGLATLPARAAGAATCTGKFPNPITDICWSCILPISILPSADWIVARLMIFFSS